MERRSAMKFVYKKALLLMIFTTSYVLSETAYTNEIFEKSPTNRINMRNDARSQQTRLTYVNSILIIH